MVVHQIGLKNFRNYPDLSLEFSKKINFFIGDNGQGKTNLLEAIYFFTNLRSFRIPDLQSLTKDSEEFFSIQAKLQKKNTTHRIRIHAHKRGKKVFLDENSVSLTSEYVKKFFSILFSPDHIANFKEYPSTRRFFFDRVLSLLASEYLEKLKEFSKLHKHKNALLRKQRESEVKVWNKLISQVVPYLINHRAKLVENINFILPSLFQELTGKAQNLQLCYKSDFLEKGKFSTEEIFQYLQEKLPQEIHTKSMLFGPHRDNYWMTLDGKIDKVSFSQGEYRVANLALNLAINQLVIEEVNFVPLLLLDDVFSELDRTVSAKVIDFIHQGRNQVFITATHLWDEVEQLGDVFHIQSGKVISNLS
ncbi:MAG: DNA replication and repair protein RecF [bacterium]|jgi:DNA replication and repair protein RecF